MMAAGFCLHTFYHENSSVSSILNPSATGTLSTSHCTEEGGWPFSWFNLNVFLQSLGNSETEAAADSVCKVVQVIAGLEVFWRGLFKWCGSYEMNLWFSDSPPESIFSSVCRGSFTLSAVFMFLLYRSVSWCNVFISTSLCSCTLPLSLSHLNPDRSIPFFLSWLRLLVLVSLH